MGESEDKSLGQGFEDLEWEVFSSRRKQASLKLGGKAIHSHVDPEAQARSWAKKAIKQMEDRDCTFLVLLGMGLGYLPKALSDLGWHSTVIWEPFSKLHSNLENWRCHSSNIHTGLKGFQQAVSRFSGLGSKPFLMVHPGYEGLCLLEKRQAVEYLDSLYTKTSKVGVHKSVVSKRSLDSLARVPFLGNVGQLQYHYPAGRAVLVSGGPSAKKILPYLMQNQNAVIFAALQVAPLLQQTGISIDFIVAADPGNMERHMADCRMDFGAFLVESACQAQTLDWVPEKTFCFQYPSDQLIQDWWDGMGYPTLTQPVATVSESMLELALSMGFKDLLICGMDGCWGEERYSYRALGTFSNKWLEPLEKRFRTVDRLGNPVQTEASYFQAARYLSQRCEHLANTGFDIFRLGNGLPIKGVKSMRDEDILPFLLGAPPNPPCPKPQKSGQKGVSLARRLLQGARKSQGESAPHRESFWGRQMPFFHMLPLGERASECQEALQELDRRERR